MGYELIELSEVDSTNNHAKQLESLPPGITVIIAQTQTAGRGRLARTWDSAPGLGLWATIVFETDAPREHMSTLTFVAANAVTSLLRKTHRVPAEIKWPNDVLVGGKKICGILTESMSAQTALTRFVIGIGLNIAHLATDFSAEINATSMRIELAISEAKSLNERLSPRIILSELMDFFEPELGLFLQEIKTSGESPSIISHWLEHNATIGATVTFEYDGALKTGQAVGVTPQGMLIVNTADGAFVNVGSGEVWG